MSVRRNRVTGFNFIQDFWGGVLIMVKTVVVCVSTSTHALACVPRRGGG